MALNTWGVQAVTIWQTAVTHVKSQHAQCLWPWLKPISSRISSPTSSLPLSMQGLWSRLVENLDLLFRGTFHPSGGGTEPISRIDALNQLETPLKCPNSQVFR
eukprot:2997558-Amphidinium_carterae.3